MTQMYQDPIIDIINEVSEYFQKRVRTLRPEEHHRVRRTYFENFLMNFLPWAILSSYLYFTFYLAPAFVDWEVLPFSARLFWKKGQSRVRYAVLFLFQMCTHAFLLPGIMTLDALGTSTVNYINMFFEMFAADLETMGEHPRPEWRMRELIVEHQVLLGFAEKVNNVFRPMFVVQVATSVMIMCMAGVQTLWFYELGYQGYAMRYATYFLYATAQMSIWYLNGNKVNWTVSTMSFFSPSFLRRDMCTFVADKPLGHFFDHDRLGVQIQGVQDAHDHPLRKIQAADLL